MKTYFTALIAASLFLSFSCTTEEDPIDDPKPTTPAKEELLAGTVSKNWKISKYLKDGYDISAQFKECEKDDFLSFYRTYKLIVDEGALSCTQDPPQKIEEKWELSSDKAWVTRINGTERKSWRIVGLTATELRLASSVTQASDEITYVVK